MVEGRGHLNFSTWDAYSPQRAERKLDEVIELVEKGAMPLASYVRMHPDADLSQAERDRIIAWARELMSENTPEPGTNGLEEGTEGTGDPPGR